MSRLRYEIARAVARAVDRALDGERAMTPPPLGEWHPLVTDATDDILANVREALLSDGAIRAACDAAYIIKPEWEDGDDWTPGELRSIRKEITAAIDAVAGEGGER